MFTAVVYMPTGLITRVITTQLAEDLEIQVLAAEEQLLVVPSEAPLLQAPQHYRISADGPVPKQQVTLAPDRLTFAADGEEEVTVTVMGLTQPGLVQVNQVVSPVTPEDAQLILTSDTPGRFQVQIPADDPYHWADAVTVQAMEE